ncbi:alpha/beta fold hydrolase [Erythrobacter arachoides]|uniref:Alpha/beta fold hydrolase n=1 Tax=Aurantiacibacter arachoides TaxID=1850444 RepID=A0A845A208_9SPHN|nr:alpha/beta hydrolase [Aurantiacibacter arachoides]MXO93610.1 alpha/beta fold hydrolase [Aurantiacibacter arachoides]GGD48062.1 epoxide hydrolase [Aurantiacibacter arachoides]
MIPSELSRVVLSTGVELDVWDTGPRDAPALIFLHGFPENHRTWRHQVAHFSHAFRCVAPDQRGYGDSSRPKGAENYAPAVLVGDVFALAEALGIERFTIVGHDWGGAIAWAVAMFGQADGRVERAVIANAPHPAVFQRLLHTDPAQRAASQYITAFRDPAHDALVREHGLGALLLKAIRWEGRAKNDPAESARMLAQWADPDRAFAMLNWYRGSSIVVPSMDAPYEEPEPLALPVLTIPTLVIWGMEDQALLPANLALGEQVTNLTLAEVPAAGHFVPWEAPDAVNAAMDGFLERTAAR